MAGHWRARAVALAAVVLSAALALAFPYYLREPDEWAFRAAFQDLEEGLLVIDGARVSAHVEEARSRGAVLEGWDLRPYFVELGGGRRAFEKSPGYALYGLPFHRLGALWLGNALLSLALSAAAYALIARLADERAACVGTALASLAPIAVVMLHRAYMDMYAAHAFLGIGACLYLLGAIGSGRGARADLALSFAGGLGAGWSAAVRITDLPLAALLPLHAALASVGRRRLLALLCGLALPLSVLLVYNATVFGSPFLFGYAFMHPDYILTFAWHYVLRGEPSQALSLLAANLRNTPGHLLRAMPFLPVAVGAAAHLAAGGSLGGARAPRHVPALLAAWAAVAFGTYLAYEWPALIGAPERSFVLIGRFYLPALLPLAALAALLMRGWPDWALALALANYALIGASLAVGAITSGPMFEPAEYRRPVSILFDRTRADVASAPTTAATMERRLDVLGSWAEALETQGGYDVASVLPPTELRALEEGVRRGRCSAACPAIDRAYARLEALARSPPPRATPGPPPP